MAGYQTGAAELIQAGKNMNDTNQELQANLSQLANEVESIASAWQGQAATAFAQLMDAFQNDAKNLNDSLNKIAEAIAGSAQAYQQQEEESARSVSSITSTLGG